jgi:hypothetical protein
MVWNSTTAADVTVTFEAAWVGALPYNDEIWFDVLYFGTSGSALGSRATNTKATILSSRTQWSASSADWSSAADARLDTHAYARGDTIAVSSSGGVVRLFVCTTAGNSAASLPGGYATAVDGSAINDSTAIFTAVSRFTMAVTLNSPQPQAAGYLYCYFKLAKDAGGLSNYQSCYIDPKPTLS